MPAKPIAVNLLGEESPEATPIGRLIEWVTTYGRYIMVTTELVVLIAFVSRFSLDRKLTDLKEEIQQKQDILEVNKDLEAEIRATQDRLKDIRTILNQQQQTYDTISAFHALIPPGVYLQNLTVTKDKLTTDAVAQSTDSFSQFLANLTASKQLTSVEIGDINKQAITGIVFSLTAKPAAPKK